MDTSQTIATNIQFIAKILEKPPQKKSSAKKKKQSSGSLNKSKSLSKSPSRSRSKSKDKKQPSTIASTPKANGNIVQIGKKLSKGLESFTFDKVFDKTQQYNQSLLSVNQNLISDMYQAVFFPLVHQFVFENKNVSILHSGNARSKSLLWISDVTAINEGLYGQLISDIFDKITLKNLQNGDGDNQSFRITLHKKFYFFYTPQSRIENIVDFFNDHQPYQNMESMIVSKEIFDLDDFLELIQYVQANNLLSISEKQGRTQVCKIRLQGANSNCEINFINLEEIDNMSKEREEYYCGFVKEIKDTYISQGVIQSKNNKFYNFSKLTQMLQSSFNQNSAVIFLTSLVSDSTQHLPNLQGLKLIRRFQNIFKFEEEINPEKVKTGSVLTTNYNTNDPNQSHHMVMSSSNQNFYQSGSNQNFFTGQSMNPVHMIGAPQNSGMKYGQMNNSQSSPTKNLLFSNQTSNYQSVQPNDDQQYPPVFGQGHQRSRSSLQFNENERNAIINNNNNNNNSLFNINQTRNPQIDQINSEIDQVNESIQHPPVTHSTFFTQWIKSKAEFIENILSNISYNKTIDGESKNFLLDKVLNLKSQLQQLNESKLVWKSQQRFNIIYKQNQVQNASPRSLPDRLMRNFGQKRTSSSPDLKQHQRDKMFEYFETPRFELEGRRMAKYGKRVSLTNSDQKILSGNTSIKSVIKSPSSKNVSTHSQMANTQQYKPQDYANYYTNMKPVYPQKQIQESDDELSQDSIDDQFQRAIEKKKKSQKTINFKGTKKSTEKKQPGKGGDAGTKQRKSSFSKKRGSSTGIRDLSNSQANISTMSKKSTQSRKSILSKKSVTSQKSVKSNATQKSVASKKSMTSISSKKSGVSSKSKLSKGNAKPKSNSSKALLGQRKSSSSLLKKVIPGSKRGSASLQGNNKQSQLKTVKSPTSLNRSRSSGQNDNSMRNYRDMKDNILQELDFKYLKNENSPSLSHSRKTSMSKSPKFTPRQLNVPALRGRSLSKDFQTQSLNESQNQSYYQASGSPLETYQQNFQNTKIKDHLKQSMNGGSAVFHNGQNIGSFSQAVQNTNLSNKNINNLFSAQQSTQVQIRQNIKDHLKTFRDMIESSSGESDYDLLYQLSNVQPSMPIRKSHKFQAKVKQFDLSFEAEKKFFIEQQGKENHTELLKNYHKLLLKSYDIQKLLEEQVNINEELQKEVFSQEEKFNILQRKYLKKKKEKQLVTKEMSDKLLEFEKMEQRDTQSRQQLQQQLQKMQNIQIQNEQQDKIIRNLEFQIEEIRGSNEKRIQEVEEVNDAQKIQIEKMTDIIQRNQLSEMDLRSQLNSKSQQFDHDMKTKREEFERQLALNQLAIKQVQTQKSIELQSYEKKLSDAAEEVDRMRYQLTQMKQKVDTNVQVQRVNDNTLNTFRREKTELADRIEELETENQQLKSDKMILQHKNATMTQQTITQNIQSERNRKEIEQSLLYYRSKQDQSFKDYNPPSSYRQALEFESRIQKKIETPQQSTQHKSMQNLTTFPTNMYQNVNLSTIPQQTQPQNNFMSNIQQQDYLSSSPNQVINNPNISVSQYEDNSNIKMQKSDRNSQISQQLSQLMTPSSQQNLQIPSTRLSKKSIDLKNLINTSVSSKISKKSKDGNLTTRIPREPKQVNNDQQQLISTQRENKKSSSLSKSKSQLGTARTVPVRYFKHCQYQLIFIFIKLKLETDKEKVKVA